MGWGKLIAIAVVSGTIFGLVTRIIESITGIKVYTLLLNVDYIPVLKLFNVPEWMEFAIHLTICVVITFVLAYMIRKLQWRKTQIFLYTVVISLVISMLLYPTTLLSERTPAFLSWPAFLWWLLLHGLYGIVLGILLMIYVGDEQNG